MFCSRTSAAGSATLASAATPLSPALYCSLPPLRPPCRCVPLFRLLSLCWRRSGPSSPLLPRRDALLFCGATGGCGCDGGTGAGLGGAGSAMVAFFAAKPPNPPPTAPKPPPGGPFGAELSPFCELCDKELVENSRCRAGWTDVAGARMASFRSMERHCEADLAKGSCPRQKWQT